MGRTDWEENECKTGRRVTSEEFLQELSPKVIAVGMKSV